MTVFGHSVCVSAKLGCLELEPCESIRWSSLELIILAEV